ncbi:MAG: hypothetical protein AAF787_00280 [Chloroflexota bacterium]
MIRASKVPLHVVVAYARFVVNTGYMQSPVGTCDIDGQVNGLVGTELRPATPDILAKSQQILEQHAGESIEDDAPVD